MFGRTRKRKDELIKETKTKKEDSQSSGDFQKVFTIPDSQAAIRIARQFRDCSWDWDDKHENIVITFNEDAEISHAKLLEALLDKDLDEREKLVENLIHHIKDYGNCWDIYKTIDGNIEAHLKTLRMDIDIVSKYLNGFGDNKDDLLYIKIKSLTQNKSITINQNEVFYFIMEELYNTLCVAMNTNDVLFKIIAEDVEDICGK